MVSIIIPCYNVESFIDECIGSVVLQSFKDIEVIAVDDGSTDGTGAILDSWAQRDSRIKVFHTKNFGRSAARNLGIEKSSGEYLNFIDSDDFVKPEYVATLFKALTENDADFSETSYYCNVLETDDIKYYPAVKEKEIYNGYSQFVEDVYLDKGKMFFINGITITSKLYKRELFDEIRFPEGRIVEDCWVFPEILIKCHKIAVLPDCLYFYRQRGNSTTRELTSHLVDSKIEAWLHNKDWWKTHKAPEHDRLVADTEKYLCHYIYKSVEYVSKEKRPFFKKQYSEMTRHILFTQYLPLKTKIKYLTFASPLLVWRKRPAKNELFA